MPGIKPDSQAGGERSSDNLMAPEEGLNVRSFPADETLVRYLEGQVVRPANMSTILVVDDQPELRLLYQRVLEREGHRVALAAHGNDAIQLMESKPFDLILLDMAMPHMDGLTFLRLVRARPEWSKIPTIILSGLLTHQQSSEARALGATDLLVKAQFSMRELRARVARHLAETQVIPASGTAA